MVNRCDGPNYKCTGECTERKLFFIIGKKNTLPIIRVIMHKGPVRFNEIFKDVGGSPKTLTDRLRELEKVEIISREVFAEIPPRVEYTLTERGKDLKPMLTQMSEWVEKWDKK